MEIFEVATEQLEAELVAHAAWEASGMARVLVVLAEFDRRQAWASWECRSAQHWLSWKCGLGYTAATERLRVARVLPTLPLISAAFNGGLLSWSKVRELTRVAAPQTEYALLNVALYGTAAQVARLVRGARRITRDQAIKQVAGREFRWMTDLDGSIMMTVRLPADRAMVVINAVQAATVIEAGVPRSRAAADALVDLVIGERGASRAEVVVHIDESGAHVEGGPAIAAEVADCLACDGAISTVQHTASGPVEVDRRRAPNGRQRKWLARRHRTCQFPGCDHAGGFEAHHVVEHAKGGRTVLANLTRLCWFHHRMVHLHRLRLAMGSDRALRVSFPAGNPVDRDVPSMTFIAETPPRPDAIGGSWCGDRLDLGLALDGLIGSGLLHT